MINDFKDVIYGYSVVGIIIAILTAFVRPFVSIWQTLREGIIVAVFSSISGLLLEQWHEVISEPTRYGIAGLVGFFAVKIYLVIIAYFNVIEKNPEKIIKQIKR